MGTVGAALVGGTSSVLGGGKFANGARTAALQYLFNQAAADFIKEGGVSLNGVKKFLRGLIGRGMGAVGTLLTVNEVYQRNQPFYHYTTARNAALIRTAEAIRPSFDSFTYMTTDRYESGEFARDRLALSAVPRVRIEVPIENFIDRAMWAGPVLPITDPSGSGRTLPGGGNEVLVQGYVSVANARFVPIERK